MTDEIDYQSYQRALQFDQRVSRVAALQSLTQLLIEELDPKKEDWVLDVGTGTGRVGVVLCDRVSRGFVVGIDSGYGMLRVAREKVLEREISNFLLVRGGAEALPFKAQTFDSACFILSSHHFTDAEQAMAEVYRTLKGRGRLVSVDPVLEEPVNEDERRLNALIEEAFQRAHGPNFRFYTVPQLRGLYEKAGFSVATCRVNHLAFQQNGLEGIPMAPHWLEAYELVKSKQDRNLLDKFERSYFSFQKEGEQLHVNGELRWVVIKAVKG